MSNTSLRTARKLAAGEGGRSAIEKIEKEKGEDYI